MQLCFVEHSILHASGWAQAMECPECKSAQQHDFARDEVPDENAKVSAQQEISCQHDVVGAC